VKLPDFLILGAMKSGTSSLHRYLEQHPEVSASQRKELDFFAGRYERGIHWYKKRFGDGIAGESSPNYLKLHLWPEVPARIREHVPDARLMCILRNPVDRTLSHYLHNVWRGREARPFSVATAPGSNLVKTSRYGWQLDHYLAHFPAEQILLLTTEELGADPQWTLRRALRFIGADDRVPIDTSQRHNVTATNLATAGARVPEDAELVVEADRIRLTPEARARLAPEFKADLDQLRARPAWSGFRGWGL
jgi:hypothetical protein